MDRSKSVMAIELFSHEHRRRGVISPGVEFYEHASSRLHYCYLIRLCGVGFLYAAALMYKLADRNEPTTRGEPASTGNLLAKRAQQLFGGSRYIDSEDLNHFWRTQPQMRSTVKLGLAFLAVAGVAAALGVWLK